MVSFFQGVGSDTTAGYGWTQKPVEPKGSRDRMRKQLATAKKSVEAVGT